MLPVEESFELKYDTGWLVTILSFYCHLLWKWRRIEKLLKLWNAIRPSIYVYYKEVRQICIRQLMYVKLFSWIEERSWNAENLEDSLYNLRHENVILRSLLATLPIVEFNNRKAMRPRLTDSKEGAQYGNTAERGVRCGAVTYLTLILHFRGADYRIEI